jgi:hypothetical protein
MQVIQYCKTMKEKKANFFFPELLVIIIPVQYFMLRSDQFFEKIRGMCSFFSHFWLCWLVTPAHPDVNKIYWTYCFSYESDFGWLLNSSLECNISFRHIDYSVPLSFTDFCPISIVPFCYSCTNAVARTDCSYAPQRGLYWFLFRELRFQVLTATNMKTLLWTRWWTLVIRNVGNYLITWATISFWRRRSTEHDISCAYIGACLPLGRCTV